MTLTALFVANSDDADTGYVGEQLIRRGYAPRTVLRDQGGLPVDLAGVDAVVLLGSDWSVHSPVDALALAAEAELVRTAQKTGVPVLALCYGAQVVAHALGGSVSLAAVPEVGFVEVLTDDTSLVPAGPWAQFHLDVIEPPPAARVVAERLRRPGVRAAGCAGCAVPPRGTPGHAGRLVPTIPPDARRCRARPSDPGGARRSRRTPNRASAAACSTS